MKLETNQTVANGGRSAQKLVYPPLAQTHSTLKIRINGKGNKYMPQMIIVKFVDDFIFKEKEKFNVQFSGISDKKPMRLQTWLIPHDTQKEAEQQRDEIKKANIAYIK